VEKKIPYADHFEALNEFLQNNKWSSIFILVDSNTHEHCLPKLLNNVELLKNVEILEVDAGEESKDIEIAGGLWLALNDMNADRNSLLINLGGGMIGDLGAWVAVNYKRGIDFIHLPTTLLAMVDASIGGKSGVNLGGIKNLVGSFTRPAFVFNYLPFLGTLPQNEWESGYAEMLKHALLSDASFWKEISAISPFEVEKVTGLIERSAQIKMDIVAKDFKESGLRKKLNYGHSLGHAIEAISFEKEKWMSHGHAVAIGMCLENIISTKMGRLDNEKMNEINSILLDLYDFPEWIVGEEDTVISKLQKDKKNTGEIIKMVLLHSIGKVEIDIPVTEKLVRESLKYAKDEYLKK
jgi:3-dehydroquinate synthase